MFALAAYAAYQIFELTLINELASNNYMSSSAAGNDWQAVGIAQAGGVYVVGGGIYCFEFRSLSGNFRGQYLFIGGALGFGGSLGGGSGPSPGDFISNTYPDLWSPIKCKRPFSGDDLNWAYAALSTLGAAGAYGYALTGISAGLVDPLFDSQEVSGWGTGVGLIGAILIGVWKQFGSSDY